MRMADSAGMRTTDRSGDGSVGRAEELRHVGGERGIVLEQEAVRGVGIDLDACSRYQAGEEVGVPGWDHRVTVPVRDEHRDVDRADALQQTMVRNAPGAHRVVLRLSGLPR